MRLPTRFRRRLLAVMLAAGLLPLFALGALGLAGLQKVLSLSPRRLDPTLRSADAALARQEGAPELREELRVSQLSLVQAELARQSLYKLAPAAILGALALAAGVLALSAVLLGRALARPLGQLTAEMARVAAGDLDLPKEPLPLADRDELQFLLARLRETAVQLREDRQKLQITEGLAAWREVARALAHELSNPLTAMKMATARLARVAALPGDDEARLHEASQLLADELEVLLKLTQSFASFAKLPNPQPRPLELSTLLTEVCALYRAAGPVEVQLEAEGPLPLQADADQLRRALGNLLKNALEASRAGDGPVRVQAFRQGARVLVRVDDGGAGIPHALSGPELARPGGTTKPGGSGLGLPIAHKIVHDHGGSLRLLPLEKGTRAELELPLADIRQ